MTAPGDEPRSTDRWRSIWEEKGHALGEALDLSVLISADGYDTPFGALEERPWREFVLRRARELGLEPGDSIFEVGCGAGAFLRVLDEYGCTVAGSDWSSSLVQVASRAMPSGSFLAEEAVATGPEPQYKAVVACGVFTYFSSLAYAEATLERMARKATGAVALYDLPDAGTMGEAMEFRRDAAGGDEAYAKRYDQLEHQFYDRDWTRALFERVGLVDVHIESQDMDQYGNARFRFNAWGFCEG